MQAIVQRSCGLDVHKKSIVATLLLENSEGSLQEETKEFGTTFDACTSLADWLSDQKIDLTVMESTGIYWKNIYAALEKKSLPVSVVNARHVKQVPGRKTDVQDSQWLARLARYGLLRASFIPEKDLRELRLIARYRTKVQRTLSGELNRLHKILDDAGVRLGNVVSDIHGLTAQDIIRGLIAEESVEQLLTYTRGALKKKKEALKAELAAELSDRHLFLLKTIQKHLASLEEELTEIDMYLFEAMKPYAEAWQILQTIPGINKTSAALLIIEIGIDMQLFGSRDQFCSWAGMCPGNNESAGKKKSGKTRKGSNQLRYLLCEAANAAIKTDCQFKQKYQSLLIRRGHKKAIVAIGHKILRVIFSVLKNKQGYQDPGIDYAQLVVNKNSARWLKMLKQYGYLPSTQGDLDNVH